MTASQTDHGARYRIRVQGRLSPQSAVRLGDMTPVVHDDPGQTVVTDLTGWISDQAALMGVLQQLYALGVDLMRVERLDPDVDPRRNA